MNEAPINNCQEQLKKKKNKYQSMSMDIETSVK